MSRPEAIRATPFHARTSASNLFNRWTARNGFTLVQDYGDPSGEALAGRTNVILADISSRWRVFVEGAGAVSCLSRMMTKDVNALAPGASLKALWLNDGGAVRGTGVVARCADDQFLLVSAASDASWFAEATRQFGVSLRDMTKQEGGLALIGPYAEATLRTAGLDADVAPLGFRKLLWRGLEVTVSRWGEQDGYEIWCNADDGMILWDRLVRAGAPFGIRPAGVSGCDILDIEAGIPRPHRDYRPARDGFATDPSSGSLNLDSLVDERHAGFNGHNPWIAARGSERLALVGVEIDAELPASFAPLRLSGRVIGQTLTSVRSPVLRRAIALAQIEKSLAESKHEFLLQLPQSLDSPTVATVAARVTSLPFVRPAEAS